MGARKRRKQTSSTPAWMGALASPFQGVAWRYLSALVIGLLAVGSTAYAWQRWGRAAIAAVDRKMTSDSLEVTPQPAWIKVDVKDEVFRDGSLAELTYLDKQLAYKVYRAFEMHACVAKVDRVGKRPSGKVIVNLRYRRPVAWVEIPRDGTRILRDSVLPIDEDAVVLDPMDLGVQLTDLIRISISELPPYGPKGTSWGDPRLVGAARLAALLQSCWRDLQIDQIRGLSPIDARRRQASVYELLTRSGQRVVWGAAPGSELSQEPKAADKLKWLKKKAAQGQLSGNGQRHLDLRVPHAEPTQRTARTPASGF